MSAKKAKEHRLLEDKNKLAGKILSLKIYCQKNKDDIQALNKLYKLVKLGKEVLHGAL